MDELQSLKDLNTFRIGGKGRVFFPKNLNEFESLLKDRSEAFVLGGGSNCVFQDGVFERPVLHTRFLNGLTEDETGWVAEAGVKLAKILDFASGVPATVGAAVRINFGAMNRQVADELLWVEILDSDFKKIKLKAEECQFGYRHSLIKEKKWKVLRAAFKKQIDYNPLPIIKWRGEKQPLSFPNAGSVFKNPDGDFAGRLIESVGLKGAQIGDVKIWEKHANMMINMGAARFEDLKALIQKTRHQVKAEKGIDLVPELELVENT